MATDKPLSEYLDHLIERAFVSRKFSGARSNSIDPENVRYYIEDEVTGRPVPIDDSADHFLLMSFHGLREEYLTRPLPVYVEPAPASGEIHWRVMHSEGKELCRICKEPDDAIGSPFCSRGHLPDRVCREEGLWFGPGTAIPLKEIEE